MFKWSVGISVGQRALNIIPLKLTKSQKKRWCKRGGFVVGSLKQLVDAMLPEGQSRII